MNLPRLLAACAFASAISCGSSGVVLRSTENGGRVQLESVNVTAGGPLEQSSSVLAGFSLAATRICPEAIIVDGCSLIDCRPPAPSSGRPASAGTLVVSGAARPITLTPTHSEYAPDQGSPGRLWDGGETLHLAAAGDVTPAFELSIVAPSYVMVDAPVWPTGGAKLSIPRAKDLDVTWSGGGAGMVIVELWVTADEGFYDVGCLYPAQSGSGKVSARVLGALPTGTSYYIDIHAETYAGTTVSGWKIDFGARANANTPTGRAKAEFVLQ